MVSRTVDSKYGGFLIKRSKLIFIVLLFLLTTLAFPWGSELCQGCRIDSSALAGPIYTFQNSAMFQQMISTNGTFLFQDAIERLPAYSTGVKLEIRTQNKSPLRLAYDVNNYVDFSVSSSGALTINATGAVVISPNGNVIVRNGNVGIGTIAPVAKLDVHTTAAAISGAEYGTYIYVQNNQSGTAGLTALGIWGNLASLGSGEYRAISVKQNGGSYTGQEVFTVGYEGTGYFAGNVGIGTIGPARKLDINNGLTSAGNGSVRVYGYQAGFEVYNAAGTGNWYFGNNDADGNKLYIGQGYGPNQGIVPKMVIDYVSGNVGIGTTSPTNKLSVAGNADFSGNVGIGTTLPSSLLHVAKNQNNETMVSVTNTMDGIASCGRIDIVGGSSQSLRAISLIQYAPSFTGTFLGVNVAKTSVIMDNTSGAADASYGLLIGTQSSTAPLIFGAGAAERMRIAAYGYIGIGTTSPGHLLTLAGGAYCDGTGAWVAGSDRAYKRDIKPLIRYGLKEVMQLQPVTFIHKEDKQNKVQLGFIAQDVKPVIPEIIEGTDGSFGLAYDRLTPVLVNAIKELKTKNDQQIQALIYENKLLKLRLETLEKLLKKFK